MQIAHLFFHQVPFGSIGLRASKIACRVAEYIGPEPRKCQGIQSVNAAVR